MTAPALDPPVAGTPVGDGVGHVRRRSAVRQAVTSTSGLSGYPVFGPASFSLLPSAREDGVWPLVWRRRTRGRPAPNGAGARTSQRSAADATSLVDLWPRAAPAAPEPVKRRRLKVAATARPKPWTRSPATVMRRIQLPASASSRCHRCSRRYAPPRFASIAEAGGAALASCRRKSSSGRHVDPGCRYLTSARRCLWTTWNVYAYARSRMTRPARACGRCIRPASTTRRAPSTATGTRPGPAHTRRHRPRQAVGSRLTLPGPGPLEAQGPS